ncbi:MAG TPA: RagB/SusD family nutrient uptake outer membrane protein [Chryseosolibacter sp.]|nr:RagB/SusD family nutrient uptake outer membrane protein [Chryseosolibacter sp.]
MKPTKYITALVLCLFAGCDDFLTVNPQNRQFDTNFYATENQVFDALIAAYDPIQYSWYDGRWVSSVMLGEIWSDNANAGGDATNFDQPGWQQIDDLNTDALTPETRSLWRKYYIGVNKTNQLLNNVRVESTLVGQYLAEAKFLRAFYYFELARTFGPVPVFTTLPDPFDTGKKRNTLSEVYTQITKDLEEAIPLLPLRYGDPAFRGRITKGAAEALLGKAYLYWADLLNDDKTLFDKAVTPLKGVIQSNQYALLDDYAGLFTFGAANSVESVFEIQYTNQVAADWGTPPAFINGNMIVQLCGIRGLCANHPLYAPGWGFMLPTHSLYNSFLPDDTYRRNATLISKAELTASGCSIQESDQNKTDETGFWQKKYANYKAYTAPGGEINVLKDANQPYIRFAEVLLMCAEALVRGTGSEQEALSYIDVVRERAKGPGNNTGNFKTASTLMSENGWTALELIWYERRAELAGEGDRWFDLVRSGRAASTLFPSGDPRAENFSAQDLYLPAPQREVDITNGQLTTYPDPSLFK